MLIELVPTNWLFVLRNNTKLTRPEALPTYWVDRWTIMQPLMQPQLRPTSSLGRMARPAPVQCHACPLRRGRMQFACRAQQQGSTEARLRDWIHGHNGFVHPSICVSEHAPCGARGVVARLGVSAATLELELLVSIPKALHLDNHHALAVMRTVGVIQDACACACGRPTAEYI